MSLNVEWAMQVITSGASSFLSRFVCSFVRNAHVYVHCLQHFVTILCRNTFPCHSADTAKSPKPPGEHLLLQRVTVRMSPEKIRFWCVFLKNTHQNRIFSEDIRTVTFYNNKCTKKMTYRNWFKAQGVESLNRLFGFSDPEPGTWKMVLRWFPMA